MRLVLITFLINLFSLFGLLHAQSPDARLDSLKININKAKQDTKKVILLNEAATYLEQIAAYDSSLAFAQKAKAIAEKTHYTVGLALAYNLIGKNLTNQGNYEEALRNLYIALKLNRDIGSLTGLALTHNYIGNVFLNQNNYSKALHYFILAKKYADESHDNRSIAISVGNSGKLFHRATNYTEAFKQNVQYLELAQKLNDQRMIAAAHNNLGVTWLSLKNPDEAIKNHEKALGIAKAVDDKRIIAFSFNNLGTAYSAKEMYTKALAYQFSSLEIKKEIGDKTGIVNSFNNLGLLYTKLKQYPKAKQYLNQGLNLSKEIGNKEGQGIAYTALAVIDTLEGNFKGAYYLDKKAAVVKDSIFNERFRKEIATLTIQFETEKKEQEIKAHLLENSVLKIRIYFGMSVAILLIGGLILFYYLRLRRKKREYEHSLLNLELIVLKSQLNPHFVANSLSAIKAFIDQQPDRASQFLSKFARLIRKVLEQSEYSLISLKEELKTVELYMQIESVRLDHGFDYKIEISDQIDPDEVMVPPLILQPSIENAIWHGLAPKPARGQIVIYISLENDLLRITIEDNGEGQRAMTDKGLTNPQENKSFGIAITRKRIEILGKELKREGYFQLNFLPDKTVVDMAIPVNLHY